MKLLWFNFCLRRDLPEDKQNGTLSDIIVTFIDLKQVSYLQEKESDYMANNLESEEIDLIIKPFFEEENF